jgi:hypothetical protein
MSTTPPPAAPPPPPGPTPAGASGTSLAPGQIIALVGAAIVALTTLLNWVDVTDEGGDTSSAHNIPASFLLNTDNAGDGGLGVGWLLILLMIVAVVGVFAARVGWLTILGGGLAAVVVVVFVFQLNSLVSDFDLDLFDAITVFPFLTLIASGAVAAGGIMALRQP